MDGGSTPYAPQAPGRKPPDPSDAGASEVDASAEPDEAETDASVDASAAPGDPETEADASEEPNTSTEPGASAEPNASAEPGGAETGIPASSADEKRIHEELLKRRQRRQKVLRKGGRSRLSDTYQWIFVILALVFLLGWLFGREACTRRITDTYGTITAPGGADGGPADGGASPRPTPDADDGW